MSARGRQQQRQRRCPARGSPASIEMPAVRLPRRMRRNSMIASLPPATHAGLIVSHAALALALGFVALPVLGATHTLDVMSVLIREYSREGSSAEYLARMDDSSYERYV